jgi:peptidyl-prolyl cis-trans isomerase C
MFEEMKITRYLGIGLLAGAFVLAGCNAGKKIAEVEGKPVTEAEFSAFLEVKRLSPKDDEQRQAMLDNYLEREALAAVVEKQGVMDETLIDAEVNEFRKEILISRYFQKYLQDKVTDDAVLNYYNTHASDYETRKVHAAHILFRTAQNMSEAERKAKLTTAQEAYSKIRADGAFDEIAKTYSEDTISGKKGGDLGWMAEGSVDKRFSETIFSLPAGEVSEPFETEFGFHIVKVLEGPMVVKQPFDTVKGRIRHQLRTQAKEAEMQRLVSEVDIEKK